MLQFNNGNNAVETHTSDSAPQPRRPFIPVMWACGETTACVLPPNKFSIWIIILIGVMIITIIVVVLYFHHIQQ